MDRPITDPSRHFYKLAIGRHHLHRLMDRYPSHNTDWQALSDAADAIDRAAIHFGLGAEWWWPSSASGERTPPANWNVPMGPVGVKAGLKD